MSSSSVNSREIILKIFSKKHSLSLTPQSLGFLQNLSETYSLNSTNLASIADSLALAYLKQDDCSSIVDADVLKKVYLNLQLNYAGGISTLDNEDYVNEDEIDPRNYLKIVDAFDIPRYSYAVDNKSFVKHNTHSIAAHPSSLSQLWLDRYNTIKQIILRNEFFSPPSTVAANNHDRDNYMKITSTKNLLGRHNHRFMLFGMLSQTTDGRHALQDPDGVVVLDLSDAVPGEGLFTEGSFVLVDGVYELLTDEPIFKTYGIGHPPSEKRSSSQDVHGHIDFLGLGGISLKDQKLYNRIEKSLDHIGFIVLSDVWLNELSTQTSLRRLFEGYNSAFNDFRPLMFIFCGNFSSQPITSSRDIREYHDSFNKLADIICEYPLLAQHSTFVFVPGPNDPWSSGTTTTLPRKRIPTTFTRTFEAKVSRTYFTSNPTRIRYFSQEIVVCRDDAMSRILRNNVKVKEENGEDGEDMDVKLKKFLVQTVIDQAHLSPFTINTRPVLWEYDHTLRLYPIPTSLILADKYDRYELKYEGCRVFNPGSFSFGMLGSDTSNSKPRLWSVYRPWNQEVEYSELPGEE
ncbi:DNA polymerase epsilon subunit B [Wallemia ichthyophaga EXF-994]|uniref:DNA polymerase epsilon subunit n=1 Tax=Wallemia ichthyophaga (strain EXF-994 / CBS 113033) TaxID=1299270 RepID=R9ALJ3_WALI9|nr:DNA polymerase epsilon subunit B [Wallemia ichthyophaga EXF-994]EOR00931.1 DNA polymerase epsilon subunit B [Wallemia ichthyophaga EXF-994]